MRFSATPIFLFVSARRAVTTSNSVHVVLFVSARRAVTTSNSVHVILFVSARRAMTTSNLVHVIRFWVSILHKPWIESEGRRGHRPLHIPTPLGSLPLEGESPVKRGKCPRSGQKGAASRRVRWIFAAGEKTEGVFAHGRSREAGLYKSPPTSVSLPLEGKGDRRTAVDEVDAKRNAQRAVEGARPYNLPPTSDRIRRGVL